MSTPTALADSVAFRSGQALMQRQIGELLRQRRRLMDQLPADHTVALRSELDVIIRAVDAIPLDGSA